MDSQTIIKEEEESCINYSSDEIFSTEECKSYLKKYGLDDKRIQAIKDNLIGLVDNIINSYIESVSSDEQR